VSKPFRISLRAGERIYVNGAVLRADRKVSLELLNDVAFLLESHVILAEETKTPLKQLYFVLQTMLIDPGRAQAARDMFDNLHPELCRSFKNEDILEGLSHVHELVIADRIYEALRTIRGLFPVEATILGANKAGNKQTLEMV
jgi:flagellar protein FlbT